MFKSKQKQFEEACKELDALVEDLQFINTDQRPIWLILLEDLDQKIQIFQWENGQIKLNEKGFPCVNWGKLIMNLPTIIAYLARIIQLSKRQ